MSARATIFCLLIATLCSPTASVAQKRGDIKGGKDHPSIGARYPGSKIVRYKTQKFDEFKFLLGRVKKRGVPGKSETLEGKTTRVSYEISKERSVLEVLRNYEIALKEKGFEILYKCSAKDCGGRAFNHTVVPYWSGFAENYGKQRYFAAKRSDAKGDVYVAVYVVRNSSTGGPKRNLIYAQTDVIEIAKMDVGLEVVKASAMQKAIQQAGHIALYGILFDLDSANIRDGSKPALAEIAKLLKGQPALKLFVVGHTDNQGKLDYNLALSQRRAASVIQHLVTNHKIQAVRLKAHGLGFLAPVATNRSDEGRQKNRRVELVER